MADKPNRAQQAGAIVRNAGAQAWDQATGAIGSALRTVFPGAAIPMQGILPLITTQTGREQVRDFTLAVSGQPPAAVTQAASARRVAQQPAQPKPSAQPKAAAKTDAPVMVLPEDRARAMLATILSKPLTISQYEHAAGTLPVVAPMGNKAPKAQDVVLGQTAQLSQQLFSQDIAQAQEIAKSDPEAARAATQKATDAFYQRQASLSGVNMQQLAQAQLLAQAQQQDDN